MEYQILQITSKDGIDVITINRAKALNALNKQTMDELAHYFGKEGPAKIKELKGVVLTGAGEKAFVAGADIKEFLAPDNFSGEDLAKRGHDTLFLIERFDRPVVAAINGFALGGGCELAMACHLRIASEKARFGQPEVNLGIIPGYGGTQRLIQYIGKTKAIELMLTGDMINAEEAYRLGLLNDVVPPEEVVNKSIALLEKIAQKGPVAIQKVIETVNAFFEVTIDGFHAEREAFGETTSTKDFVEGATAFIEKRKPNFKGM